MTDDEITKRIGQQVVLAGMFGLMAQLEGKYGDAKKAAHLRAVAGAFAAHSIRLIYTHRVVCERWLDARKK